MLVVNQFVLICRLYFYRSEILKPFCDWVFIGTIWWSNWTWCGFTMYSKRLQNDWNCHDCTTNFQQNHFYRWNSCYGWARNQLQWFLFWTYCLEIEVLKPSNDTRTQRMNLFCDEKQQNKLITKYSMSKFGVEFYYSVFLWTWNEKSTRRKTELNNQTLAMLQQ